MLGDLCLWILRCFNKGMPEHSFFRKLVQFQMIETYTYWSQFYYSFFPQGPASSAVQGCQFNISTVHLVLPHGHGVAVTAPAITSAFKAGRRRIDFLSCPFTKPREFGYFQRTQNLSQNLHSPTEFHLYLLAKIRSYCQPWLCGRLEK